MTTRRQVLPGHDAGEPAALYVGEVAEEVQLRHRGELGVTARQVGGAEPGALSSRVSRCHPRNPPSLARSSPPTGGSKITRPLAGRRQSVTIVSVTRGPVEYSVCHEHHQA